MKKILKEFKDFIARGNVLDMAIGVIIAGAFGKITTSLVNDVLMPFIGWICGTRDMTALNIVDAAGQFTIYCEGVTPQKIPDRTYDQVSGNVSWTLLAASISEG